LDFFRIPDVGEIKKKTLILRKREITAGCLRF
jgi:hypothetical protein